jgi:hypothetical protein
MYGDLGIGLIIVLPKLLMITIAFFGGGPHIFPHFMGKRPFLWSNSSEDPPWDGTN